MATFDDRERERERWRDQINENSARLAYSWGETTTKGSGGLAYGEHIKFDITFLERPFMSYGYVITKLGKRALSTGGGGSTNARAAADEGRDEEEADISDLVDLPQSTGFVYRWVQDAKDYYVGAHVGVVVESASDNDELEHHFTFMGNAMKDVDISDIDDGDDPPEGDDF